MPSKVPKTFFLDGVCLSETGLNQIRELSLRFAEKKQRPRWRRNPSTSTHPALLMMMSEKMSEDDQENADSKTATMGLYHTAMDIQPYQIHSHLLFSRLLCSIYSLVLYNIILVLLLLFKEESCMSVTFFF